MKYCPNCGGLYGDDLLMCPKCNCELMLRDAMPMNSGNAGTGAARNTDAARNTGAARGAGAAQGQRAQNGSANGAGYTNRSNGAGGAGYANGSNGAGGAGSAYTRNTQNTQNTTSYQTTTVYYRGPRVLSFYEKTWFIVLCFFLFWPAAIGLIILRIRRNELYNSASTTTYTQGPSYGGNGTGGYGSGPAQTGGSQARPTQTGNAQARPAQAGSTQAYSGGNTSAGYAGTQTSGSYTRSVPPYIPTGKSGVPTTLRLVIGIILLICGFSEMPSAWHYRYYSDFGSTCAAIAFLVVLGAILTGQALMRRGDCAKFEPLINRRGNTRISFIASALNMSESKVRTKLQKLVNKGFLREANNNIAAYISGEYNLVVMTWNGTPIVPIEETMKDELTKKQEEAEKARRAAPMDIEDRYHLVLQDNLPSITDEEVAKSLKNIDRSIRNIGALTKSNAELKDNKSIQNMKTKYIPKAVEYIERYVKPTTSAEMKERLKNMFATLDEAFENIEEQIVRREEFGTDIELDVLKNTLASEGVLDSDFDLNVKK